MEPSSYTIHARVGSGALDKADRLFRNDDTGTFVELLQNSRRAGATVVEVTITEPDPSALSSVVTIHDNGRGIQDFAQLLTLWESGWDQTTKTTEDPAGIGFYSLCRSGVEVSSGSQYSNITPKAFLGKASATVEQRDDCVSGTRLRFIRSGNLATLTSALRKAAEFYPIEVRLNGESLPRHDFLAGALHREVIDGVEIGFSTHFSHDMHYRDENWNFYGARIHESFHSFAGVVPAAPAEGPQALYVRFNVLETGRIKLQLPDRRNVIQDEFFHQFCRKVRAAAYRWFQRQERHLLSFSEWKDAQDLGVELPEAACQLKTWSNLAHDEFAHAVFDEDRTEYVSDVRRVMIVDDDVANRHTLQGALHSGAKLEYILYRERREFSGYSWYDSLPRLVDIDVIVDGVSTADQQWNTKARPKKIELALSIERPGEDHEVLKVPAFIHVESDEPGAISFVAVENSPWDNDQLNGSFDMADFLVYATFSYWEEGDTWETQLDQHSRDVQQLVNEYFRGPRASLVALLNAALTPDIRHLADQLKVCGIRLNRQEPSERSWEPELVGVDGQPL